LGGKCQKVVSAAQYDGVFTAIAKKVTLVNTTVYTVSALVRGSGTAMMFYETGDDIDKYGTPITLPSGWALISKTFTATASAVANIGVVSNDGTSTIYVAAIQCEASPYSTSFIPTTTAAMTRNAETLKYAIAGNRTAATESIAIKFMPLGGSFANDGIDRFLCDTDTKQRYIKKATTETVCKFRPNNTDSSASAPAASTTSLLNTSYNVVGVAYGATADVNAEIFIDGASEGTDSDNYTSPIWGTNMYMGSDNAGANQLNGLIQKVAIFSRALTAPEVASVSSLLGS
jgi:hypothetical protein